MLRLGTKVTGLCLALCAAPSATLGFLALEQERESLATATAAARDVLTQRAEERLGAMRDTLRSSIESHAARVEVQLSTLAETPSTIAALRAFVPAFEAYPAERGLDENAVTSLSRELAGYYSLQFDAEYGRHNAGVTSPSSEWLSRLDEAGVALQHAFVHANQHQLGKKHLLDRPAGDTSTYARLHGELHASMRGLLERAGYYDIFLVDNDGTVVYTVFKELDFATSLSTGAHSRTGLADAWRRAAALPHGAVAATDLQRYAPSYEAPAAFAAAPVFAGEERLGVVAVQLPLEHVTRVMSQRSGLGATGEAFLVGQDRLMRSDSFRDPEHHTVLASFRDPRRGKVENEPVMRALSGTAAVASSTNYAGRTVIGAYAPVSYLGTKWALCLEQEASEALAAAAVLEAEGQERYTRFTTITIVLCVVTTLLAAAAAVRLTQSLARQRAHASDAVLAAASRLLSR